MLFPYFAVASRYLATTSARTLTRSLTSSGLARSRTDFRRVDTAVGRPAASPASLPRSQAILDRRGTQDCATLSPLC